MEFASGGAHVHLHSLRDQNLQDTTHTSLKRNTRTQTASQFLHLSISVDPNASANETQIVADPNAPEFLLTNYTSFLTIYEDIFSFPICLSPVRDFYQRISFMLEITLISVWSYQYAYFQKMEIEWLVVEMLKDGVIRPSMSSFLSPMILVKKKDGTWRCFVDYLA